LPSLNKQRKYQLKAARRGQCQKCPRRSVKGRALCRRCLKADRERNQKKRRRLRLAAKRVAVKGRRRPVAGRDFVKIRWYR